MIRGYEVYKDVCETNAEGPFGSDTAAKQKCPLSWSTCTRYKAVTHAVATELQPRYKCDCGIKICEPVIIRSWQIA